MRCFPRRFDLEVCVDGERPADKHLRTLRGMLDLSKDELEQIRAGELPVKLNRFQTESSARNRVDKLAIVSGVASVAVERPVQFVEDSQVIRTSTHSRIAHSAMTRFASGVLQPGTHECLIEYIHEDGSSTFEAYLLGSRFPTRNEVLRWIEEELERRWGGDLIRQVLSEPVLGTIHYTPEWGEESSHRSAGHHDVWFIGELSDGYRIAMDDTRMCYAVGNGIARCVGDLLQFAPGLSERSR